MKVNSKFIINKIRLKQLSVAAVRSLEQTGEALKTEVQQAQVIPRDTGNLQGEAFSVDRRESRQGKVRLVHSAPYARRVYFNPDGLKFHRMKWKSSDGKEHDGNPNARDHWYEDWMPGGSKQDFCINTFKHFYRRNARLE